MKYIIPLIAILVIIFSCSKTENSSEFAKIPDEQLAGYISRALDLEEDEPIPISKMKELTELKLGWARPFIYDLTGLENATNLTYLKISAPYDISDITPLAKLTKLKTLRIYDNSISDLSPLSGLTQLTSLMFLDGYVEDLSPLENLTQLTELYIDKNRIRDITPIGNLTQLKELTILDNPLSDISPIANLKELESLELSKNQISDISPLAGLPQLTGLSIDENLISDISPLEALIQLRSLRIQKNNINDLSPLRKLTLLSEFLFYNNPVTDISLLANLQKIESLVVRDPFPDISPLGKMTQLKTLKFEVPPPEIESLAPLTQLTSLEIIDSNINDISALAGMTELKTLTLYRNQIEDISPLSGVTKLEKLELYRNKISDISALAGMTELIELRLDGNKIVDISPLANLTRLTVLGLERNEIRDIKPIEDLRKLKILYLKHNPVEDPSPAQKFITKYENLNDLKALYPRDGPKPHQRVFHQHETRTALPEGAIARLGNGGINVIRFSPNGKFFAVGSDIGIYLYDVATGKELVLPNKQIGQVNTIAFSSDSHILAIGGYLKPIIQLWNLETFTKLSPISIPVAETWNMNVHIHSVFALAFAVKDTTLVCISHNGEINSWDLNTREKITEHDTVRDPEGHVLALSQDGRIFARGYGIGPGMSGYDGEIKLWNTYSGNREAELKGHRRRWPLSKKEVGIRSLEFSADGKIFASGSEDMTVRIWNTEQHSIRATLKGHTGWVTALAFSKDGNTLASGDTDGFVRVWNVRKKREVAVLKGHFNQILALAFAPDENTLASGSADGSIHFWNPHNGEKIETIATGFTEWVEDMVFSEGNTTLSTAMFNNTVHKYDIKTGKKISEFNDSIQKITHALALSPDGTHLACHPVEGIISFNAKHNWRTHKSYQGHEKIQVWNMSTGKELPPLMQAYGKMAFSPDNKLLASLSSEGVRTWIVSETGSYSSGGSNGIYLWDIEENRVNFNFPVERASPSAPITFSSDGSILITSTGSRMTNVWDMNTRELLHTLPIEAYRLALSNDGRLLAVKESRRISVWDLTTGILKSEVDPGLIKGGYSNAFEGAAGKALAFSPDTSILCVASVDPFHMYCIDKVDLIDLETGRKLLSLPGHTEPIEILKFSRDGKVLASGSQDGTVLLWDWDEVLIDVMLENNWQIPRQTAKVTSIRPNSK